MNDKCSAGTGKFLEIMANRLGVTLQELFDMADKGTVLPISSLCTVFAESEVINYIGEGQKREDIAAGVVDSVANKVAQLAMKKNLPDKVILTAPTSRRFSHRNSDRPYLLPNMEDMQVHLVPHSLQRKRKKDNKK